MADEGLGVGTIWGKIGFEDQFTRGIDLFVNKAGAALDKVGQNFTRAGSALSTSITLPLTAAAGAATYFASSYEAVTAKLVSLAGVQADELEMVRAKMLALAPETGVGPLALADAMTKISSTVEGAIPALEILEIAAKGSAAGLGTALDVAGALTAVINSYGKENITAARAADILTKAIQLGGAEAKELAPTLANVVPLAAQLGISFEEVAANIATVTKLGVPATEAVTQLSSVFSALLKETKQGSAALATVGYTFESLRETISKNGLQATLNELTQRFGENKAGLADVFGRIEALRNVLSSAGQQFEIYAGTFTKIKDSAGTLDGAFKAMAETQAFTWASVTAQIQSVAIEFGNALAPSIKAVVLSMKPLLDTLVSLVKWFADLPQPVRTAAIAFAAIAAVLGPALYLIGGIATGISALLPIFGSTNGAIYLFSKAWIVLNAEISLTSVALGTYNGVMKVFVGGANLAGTAIKGLWAAMAAHPLIATAAGITLVTTALIKMYEASQKAALQQQEAGAKQDSINLAIQRGAKINKDAADAYKQAIAYNDQWLAKRGVKHSTTGDPNDIIDKTAEQVPNTPRVRIPGSREFPANTVLTDPNKTKEVASALEEVNQKIRDAQRDFGKLTAVQQGTIASYDKIGLSNHDIAVKTNLSEAAISNYTQSLDKAKQEAQQLTEVTLKMIAAESDIGMLSAGQMELAEHFKEIGMSTKETAELIGSSEGAVKRFEDSMQDAVTEVKEFREVGTAGANAVEKSFAGMPDVLLNMARGMHRVNEETGELEDLAPLAAKQIGGIGTLIDTTFAQAQRAITQMRNAASADFRALTDAEKDFIHEAQGLGYTADEIASAFHLSLSKVQTELYSTAGVFKDAFSGIASSLTSTLMQAFTGGGGLLGAAKALGTQLASAIVTPMLEQIKRIQSQIRAAGGTSNAVGAVGVGAGAAGAVGGAYGGTAGAIIGSTAATISGAALASTITSAVALGAATAGIGLAAVGAYIALKKMFTLSAEYKAARAAQADLGNQLLEMATAAEKASAPLTKLDKDGKRITDNFQVINTVARNAFLQFGYSAEQAEKKVKELLNTHDVKAYAAAQEELGKVIEANAKRTTDVADGVAGVVDAFKSAGSVIPTTMIESIQALLKMNGLTNEQKLALQGIVDEAEPDFAQLTKLAADYGITLEALGPKFQQKDIEATAKKLFDTFTALTQAGADTGGVLLGMSDEFSKLIQDAIKFGSAIPENLRPLIENLAKAGKLTDENGNAITDISNLTFEDTPLDRGLQKLNEAIEHLAQVLDSIPAKAAAAANALTGLQTGENENSSNRRSASATASESSSSASSRAASYQYTTGSSQDVKSSSGSSTGSSSGTTIVFEMDKRTLAEVLVSEIPGAITRAGVSF